MDITGFTGLSSDLRGESPDGEFFLDNLLIQIHLLIEMIRWTGLA
jgi:hypothetical protein